MSATYYVYETEGMAIVEAITGGDNDAVEAYADERYELDSGMYAATYSPAIGASDGLTETSETIYTTLDA